jgi:hypothetical protein
MNTSCETCSSVQPHKYTEGKAPSRTHGEVDYLGLVCNTCGLVTVAYVSNPTLDALAQSIEAGHAKDEEEKVYLELHWKIAGEIQEGLNSDKT